MADDVEQIKDRLDVAEVIGEHVALKQAGRHYKALCPFHSEKTPSFVVSPDKQIWHCFGCHKGGDVISFVQEIEGVDFRTALQQLAERAGVELSNRGGAAQRQTQDRRQRLLELLDLTARFYHELLANQEVGAQAREYLKKRGVTTDTQQSFSLGYAPKSWDTLQSWLRAKGFSPQEMVAAGVAGEASSGKLYDRFRGRIMFPIADVQGRVVAFGGRIAPWHETGEEGKYVNSPETELYEKRRVVYNLDKAKQHLRNETPCLVVEGYMDVVMLVQAGVKNVVASSGTAFTDEAIALLKRYTRRLHFAFDPDAAGFQAAITATQSALSAGMRVATVLLPAGSDPADVALQSPKELKSVLSSPRSLTAALLQKLQEADDGSMQEAYLETLLPFVARTTNLVHQGEMIQELALSLHVPEERILEHLRATTSGSTAGGGQAADDDEVAGAPPLAPEERLLGLLLVNGDARRNLLEKLDKRFILAEDALALYNVLHGLAGAHSDFFDWEPDKLIANIPEKLVSYSEMLRQLAEDHMARSHMSLATEGQKLLAAVQRRFLEGELDQLQRALAAGEAKDRARTLQEFKRVTDELAQLTAQPEV